MGRVLPHHGNARPGRTDRAANATEQGDGHERGCRSPAATPSAAATLLKKTQTHID